MSRTGKRKIKRGDVLLVDLGAPEHGSEQAGRRPVVVVSKEEGVTRDAVALCAQTRSLDAVRILRKAGRLNKDTLERVTKGVLIQIGIEPMTFLS